MKVYIVRSCGGEDGNESLIEGVFSTQEKAAAYLEHWNKVTRFVRQEWLEKDCVEEWEVDSDG